MTKRMAETAITAPPHVRVELALAWAQGYYDDAMRDPMNPSKHDLDLCWALLNYLFVKSRETNFSDETNQAAMKLRDRHRTAMIPHTVRTIPTGQTA